MRQNLEIKSNLYNQRMLFMLSKHLSLPHMHILGQIGLFKTYYDLSKWTFASYTLLTYALANSFLAYCNHCTWHTYIRGITQLPGNVYHTVHNVKKQEESEKIIHCNLLPRNSQTKIAQANLTLMLCKKNKTSNKQKLDINKFIKCLQ